MKKYPLFLLALLFLLPAQNVFAHQPVLVFLQQGNVQIQNPEISRAFYDELKGTPKDYFINSDKDFNLYINLLTPAAANPAGRYSAKVFLVDGNSETEIAFVDASTYEWEEYYEEFGRDWYFKGPEFEKQVTAGKYKIEVFSADNIGKYVLAVGKTESFDVKSVLNILWQIPFLKISFFKTSVLQFFLTPFGIGLIAFIGAIIILVALVNFIVGLIRELVKHNQAKTLLLTSAGMAMKAEIVKLLQKPAYDVNVGFITTAYKNKIQEDEYYVNTDLKIMKELGFNVQEIDIDGKRSGELMRLFQIKDIIFIADGNVFYLLASMKKCGFEGVIRKLLKRGIVYVGAGAGSLVTGYNIETAEWFGEKNMSGLKNLKALNLIPFNILAHYKPEYAEITQKKIQKSKYPVKIITDEQAVFVQGKDVAFIGQGELVEFKKKVSITKMVFMVILFVIVIFLGIVGYAYYTGSPIFSIIKIPRITITF